MKIKVGSDFSGVGAFNQALMRLGIDYEELFACDMDKYARQTFIHNYGEPKYYPSNVYEREIPKESLDIYMTSPPCQSFSMAGKRAGKDDEKGRGILFFNSLEFIQNNKPRFFIFENVKGLLSHDKTNKDATIGSTFQEWINYLGGKSVNGLPTIFPYEDAVPYHIYWKVLNAKEHGVPQNRERVFIIGIRDDKDNSFTFPIEEHLSKTLKDILEEEIFEKYYLSDKMVKVLETHNNAIIKKENPEHSATIHAGYFKMGGRDQQYVKSNLDKYYLSDKMLKHLEKHERAQDFIDENTQNTNCITSNYAKQSSDLQYFKVKPKETNNYKIRRLTPRECFRLMDFPDTFDFSVVSDSQAYKQAGNSIVVRVLEKIISKLPL